MQHQRLREPTRTLFKNFLPRFNNASVLHYHHHLPYGHLNVSHKRDWNFTSLLQIPLNTASSALSERPKFDIQLPQRRNSVSTTTCSQSIPKITLHFYLLFFASPFSFTSEVRISLLAIRFSNLDQPSSANDLTHQRIVESVGERRRTCVESGMWWTKQ
ncbi:hypothetical protein BDN70DRAFT_700544 [Pholiota conissans]|uniref:Uncharacterized protein n=1 Tax=Pholiota conissans TaxID=109636 RepID=A0A9P6CL98_9AGAR|nr:hypothetical protein BDN70DRAFT_700544 [Pholiota conissans]